MTNEHTDTWIELAAATANVARWLDQLRQPEMQKPKDERDGSEKCAKENPGGKFTDVR